MLRASFIVLSVLLALCFLGAASSSITHRHRRHHHKHNHHHDDRRATTDLRASPASAAASAEQKLNATETLKGMLQTSPKDALLVTKRRQLRKDWCQSQPLIQRIGQDQCLSTTILNRFCYGQCNSFFIPKNQMKDDGDQHEGRRAGDAAQAIDGSGIAGTAKAFRSCAVCQPKKTSWVTVTLKCPSLVPNIRRRRVLVVNQCRCMQPESASLLTPSS